MKSKELVTPANMKVVAQGLMTFTGNWAYPWIIFARYAFLLMLAWILFYCFKIDDLRKKC